MGKVNESGNGFEDLKKKKIPIYLLLLLFTVKLSLISMNAECRILLSQSINCTDSIQIYNLNPE